jgi:uncharacterized protein YndB with AHSA1/START domain
MTRRRWIAAAVIGAGLFGGVCAAGPDDERALALLGTLAGGEWIHEGQIPDGQSIRVLNVIREGPDGRSLVTNGWLGYGDGGMFDHGPTLIWLDPLGVVRFAGVHEDGSTGSGVVRLFDDASVEWDWLETTTAGQESRYAIGMTFEGEDRYATTFEIVADDGSRRKLAGPMEYRRVAVAPLRFRTLTTGETIAGPINTTERHGMDHGKRIEITEIIPASVGEVWESWTTSEGMTAFLGAPADIELRRGGKYEIYFDETAEPGSRGSETCEVLGYIPGRMLSFTWNAPPKFTNCRFLHTWVVVELRPIGGDRTEVTITHEGWDENLSAHPQYKDEWEGVRAYFQNAWPSVMNALRAHHEKG